MSPTQEPPADPNDRLVKVVIIANFARFDFGRLIDNALSKEGITRKDFPEGWDFGRNMIGLETSRVQYWGDDEVMLKLKKTASDTWGPWILNETFHEIRVDRFQIPVIGHGVVGLFRSHDFLASLSANHPF